MLFKDVVGQERIKSRLIRTVKEERISHAQLFVGAEGSGALAMALAYAQYIACEDRQEADSCGRCPSCLKHQKLVHPDLHFAFPVATTKKVKSKPSSADFMSEWRETLLKQPYMGLFDWLQAIEVENKQGAIGVEESNHIIKALSYKAFEAEFKILLIWMPELMNTATANKLLKLIEEPAQKTLIILITEDEERLLSTIRSRTQAIKFPRLKHNDIQQYLQKHYQLNPSSAERNAAMVEGNLWSAIQMIEQAEDDSIYFDLFVNWMRNCFKADIVAMCKWTEEIAGRSMGREKQKNFLLYALHLVRECMMANYGDHSLNRLTEKERQFLGKFAPFVHGSNVLSIYELLNEAHYHVQRNANPKILFMDMSMKFANLLRVKNVILQD